MMVAPLKSKSKTKAGIALLFAFSAIVALGIHRRGDHATTQADAPLKTIPRKLKQVAALEVDSGENLKAADPPKESLLRANYGSIAAVPTKEEELNPAAEEHSTLRLTGDGRLFLPRKHDSADEPSEKRKPLTSSRHSMFGRRGLRNLQSSLSFSMIATDYYLWKPGKSGKSGSPDLSKPWAGAGTPSDEWKSTKSSKSTSDNWKPASEEEWKPSKASKSSSTSCKAGNKNLWKAPSPVFDLAAPLCEDKSEDVFFIAFKGIASDFGEDKNQNGILDEGEDSNGNCILDPDTGIANVQLVNSTNLQLELNIGQGNAYVTIDATRTNDAIPANGNILVQDRSGKSCDFNVNLEPFDQELFDEDYSFPATVYEELFEEKSEFDVPFYSVPGLREEEGSYEAKTYKNVPFQIDIKEIFISSTNLTDDILTDPETAEDVLRFVNEGGYTSFVFVGTVSKSLKSVDVVALAYTYKDIHPEYRVSVFSDTEDVILQSQTRELQGRELQGDCSGLVDQLTCPPGETPEVDQVCIDAAQAAYNIAVNAAQGKYDDAITAADIALKVRCAFVLRQFARFYAKQLIPCVLIGALSGGVGGALCAARALAIAIAKKLALKLAIKAAIELLKRNALAILEAALRNACIILEAAAKACIDCEGPPTLKPTARPTPRPTQPPGRRSGIFGDPHLSSFDRLRFDCQAAGEFVTVTSLEDPSFQIQERFTAVGSNFCTQASVSTSVAIQDTDMPTIQISTPRSSNPGVSLNTIGNCPIDLYVNGTSRTLGEEFGDKVEVVVSGSSISIVNRVTFVSVDTWLSESSSFGCHFRISVFIPNSYRSGETILGLLGTPNGNRGDDWRAPNGTIITPPSTEEDSIFAPSYNYCVDNWCIQRAADSIFTYGSGESFDDINGCDEDYADDIEASIQNPPADLVTICADNVFCLVDGLCGNLDDARQALVDEAEVEQEQEAADPTPTEPPSISSMPSGQPSSIPSSQPSSIPSSVPSGMPSENPSLSTAPSSSAQPSSMPSSGPSSQPSSKPSSQPSSLPSSSPTTSVGKPGKVGKSSKGTGKSGKGIGKSSKSWSSVIDHWSDFENMAYMSVPMSMSMSMSIFTVPEGTQPSTGPSESPSKQPSTPPSANPMQPPSVNPSKSPSFSPSKHPTSQPTTSPSKQPSTVPSASPSKQPSTPPSANPTQPPSINPSKSPSSSPSKQPTSSAVESDTAEAPAAKPVKCGWVGGWWYGRCDILPPSATKTPHST